MTPSQKRFLYHLFTLTLLFILSYVTLDLAAATYHLSQTPLPSERIDTLQTVAHFLREAGLLLGFFTGGLHITVQNDLRLIQLPLYKRLWHQLREDVLLRFWALGLLIVVIGSVLLLAPLPSNIQQVVLSVRLYVGYLLAGLSIAFWLMMRFSNVMRTWALRGLRSTGLMLSTAGILISLAHMLTLDPLIVVIVPVAYIVFAAHSYRALSDHNSAKTLSAHWLALGMLLMCIGAVLATVLSLGGVQPYIMNTPWRDLQYELAYMGLLAWTLSLLNQAVAELREHNRRVTGYIPVWMISSGILGSGFVLALISIVTSYALYVFDIAPEQFYPTFQPLYFLWIGGKLLITIGMGVYGTQYYARRLKI